DAIRQYDAVLGRAVVVFARRDVAAASGGVDLQHFRIVRTAALAGQADEIRRHLAAAVVAHRVRRIGAERHQRRVAVPETQGLQEWVDGAFLAGANLRVAAGAHAVVLDLAIFVGVTAIGRHFLYLRLPHSQ